MRQVTHHYQDPLDRVWLQCANAVGLRVVRTADAYATTDGRGTLAIATAEHLDADDCLAQMVLHEICHALVQGPDGDGRPDWGLDNQTDRDVPREHACLRTQAALAAPHGLREFLGPTTDFRAYYDELPGDPLSPADHPTVIRARMALVRAQAKPWALALRRALEATAAIARAAGAVDDLAEHNGTANGSLYRTVAHPWRPHPSGAGVVSGVHESGATCGTCAWRFVGGRGKAVARCRRGETPRVDDAWPACEGWEPDLDCQTCGACCREAYGSVTISRREPFVKKHPELVVVRETYVEVARTGPRCAALAGGPASVDEPFDPRRPYACTVYDDRPTPCRDLQRGGEHCLTARKRVGLSR